MKPSERVDEIALAKMAKYQADSKGFDLMSDDEIEVKRIQGYIISIMQYLDEQYEVTHEK